MTKSAVHLIISNREKYEQYKDKENIQSLRKLPSKKLKEVEKELKKYVDTVNKCNLGLSYKVLREKALKISSGNPDEHSFKASDGYIRNFLKRNSLTCQKLCGKASSVDEVQCALWKEIIPSKVTGYGRADILNFDETSFFYKKISDHTFAEKGTKVHGAIQSKERITVALMVSQYGVKLKPLVIAKAAKPRCFREINHDLSKLPVFYYANQNAWMTSGIYTNYFTRMNDLFQSQSRKVLIFVDNFAGHPNLSLSHIRFDFFPPNTTSHLQPLDQGIIHSFKSKYKANLLSLVLSDDLDASECKSKLKNLDLLTAIRILYSSWSEVKADSIVNCWRKCGFD